MTVFINTHDYIFFFFSSRRRHTRYWRDWSSDVCSSDLFKNINKSKEIKRLKKVLKRKQRKVSRKYDMNKIIRGGENRCQFKKTNNIIKLEKEIRLLHRRLRSIRSNHIQIGRAHV